MVALYNPYPSATYTPIRATSTEGLSALLVSTEKLGPMWAGFGTKGRRAEVGFLPGVEPAGTGRYPFCGATRGHIVGGRDQEPDGTRRRRSVRGGIRATKS